MTYNMTSVFSFEIQALPEISKKELDTPADVLDRTTFLQEFKTEAYLEDFYTKIEEPAMQMVLNFLPNIVARIGNVKRVLDFGAGPTIHVAAAFRNNAEEIYLADYLPQNREELTRWLNNQSNFNWDPALKLILIQEGADPNTIASVVPLTKSKVKGVFHCDCFSDPSVDATPALQAQFDVIVSTFCTEYCCNSYDEYKVAVKNIAKQIKSGGFFVMGGILEETWCSFGGRKFTCLYITRDMMLEALREAGLHVRSSDRRCLHYEINGMFLVCAIKM